MAKFPTLEAAREHLQDIAYGIWYTKDGRTVKVKEMDDAHLIKSILRIKFSPTLWRKEYLPTLERELARRNLTEADLDEILSKSEEDGHGVPAKDGKLD